MKNGLDSAFGEHKRRGVSLKVLMFGWEFPPIKSGGLGTACYDLTKGLSWNNVDVTFVMPHAPDNAEVEFVKLIGADNFSKKVQIKKIKTLLTPYLNSHGYSEIIARFKFGDGKGNADVYGENIYQEVQRLAAVAQEIANEEHHDIIHAHDWMTYEAGIEARKASNKPLVVHIHATEHDRTGGNPDPMIADIEYRGMMAADRIIANSEWTKQNVIHQYQINPDKIDVVHWGVDYDKPEYHLNHASPFKNEKLVLFLGRITLQKGPDYFIEVASNVLKFNKNVRFLIAGSGDMTPRIINRVNELGISDKVNFAGFLKGEHVHRAFQMADLYVMPSTSEPFGIVALESMKNGTPTLLSKQSGCSEVIKHSMKADFWDINLMTDQIVSYLRYNCFQQELTKYSDKEAKKFNLNDPAKKTLAIYQNVLHQWYNHSTT